MIKFTSIFALLLSLAAGFATPIMAQERPCIREEMQQCFSFQFLQVRSTPSLERLVRSDLANSGQNVLNRIERGTARFDSRRNGGALFIFLKPEIADDPNFRIPANLIREFQYSTNSPNPRAVAPTFETNPANFPKLDDPRLPGLGAPDYVLVGTGGRGGIGWSIPKSLRDMIAYAVFCPADGVVTSYPDRRGNKSLGIHFTPEDFIEYRTGGDWEYVLTPILVTR